MVNQDDLGGVTVGNLQDAGAQFCGLRLVQTGGRFIKKDHLGSADQGFRQFHHSALEQIQTAAWPVRQCR